MGPLHFGKRHGSYCSVESGVGCWPADVGLRAGLCVCVCVYTCAEGRVSGPAPVGEISGKTCRRNTAPRDTHLHGTRPVRSGQVNDGRWTPFPGLRWVGQDVAGGFLVSPETSGLPMVHRHESILVRELRLRLVEWVWIPQALRAGPSPPSGGGSVEERLST